MSGGRPQMLMCYLCGREFGSRSLPIHVPQCEKKWLAQEKQKPLSEQKPLPPRPERLAAVLAGTSLSNQDRATFNEEMYNNYDQEVLEKCAWCGRTFTPAALKIHAKSCTEESPAKPAGTGLTKASLSNTIVPGKVYGTRHVGSQNLNACVSSDGLGGAQDLRGMSPQRTLSPMRRAASAKRIRAGSKGPMKASPVTPPPPGALVPAASPVCIYKQEPSPVLGVYTPVTPGQPPRPPVVVWSSVTPAPLAAPSTVATPPAAVVPCTAVSTPPKVQTPRNPGHAGGPVQSKAANFCSDCGMRFVPSAKFCHECGALRPGAEPPKRTKFCHTCGARSTNWSCLR